MINTSLEKSRLPELISAIDFEFWSMFTIKMATWKYGFFPPEKKKLDFDSDMWEIDATFWNKNCPGVIGIAISW